jgi:hypothetical protein
MYGLAQVAHVSTQLFLDFTKLADHVGSIPTRPTFFASVIHAVRQLFPCRVGSNPVTL